VVPPVIPSVVEGPGGRRHANRARQPPRSLDYARDDPDSKHLLHFHSLLHVVRRRRQARVSAQGLIVWSHLSKRPSADGKLLYRSGVRWAKPGQLKVFRSEQIPPDQVMLIQHARERLRSHPDEALKWYNRAKYALVEDDTAIGESLRHRDDVLAVWEYLERSVPIETIASVFERK